MYSVAFVLEQFPINKFYPLRKSSSDAPLLTVSPLLCPACRCHCTACGVGLLPSQSAGLRTGLRSVHLEQEVFCFELAQK